MIKIELVYDSDCPNVKEARTQLLRAFAEAGLPPMWQEWSRNNADSPAYIGVYGSPTILINGQDIDDASLSEGADCCRLYADASGNLRGVPSVEKITLALSRAKGEVSSNTLNNAPRSRWQSILGVLPGIGVALLPKLTCPACWPAYTGLLSSFGLGFINYTSYLLPLTALFLIFALASFGYRAKNRRGYKPLILGVIAAIIVIISKFVFASDLAMYGGIALLMGASLWNSWPKRRKDSGSCPACVPSGPLTKEGNTDKA